MAKVTITITDNPRGTATASVEFNPPLTKRTKGTPAQNLAAIMLKAAQENSESSKITRVEGK